MSRILVIVLLLLGIAAAPPPKEDGPAAIERKWGAVTDPKKDCTVKLVGARLTVKVPGKPHPYDSSNNVVTAPRLLQDRAGDFVATVTLFPGSLPMTAKVKYGFTPTATAGLLLTNADGTYHARVGIERIASDTYKRVLTFGDMAHQPPGGWSSPSTHIEDPKLDKPYFLRLSRTGTVIGTAVSTDGKTWHTFDEVKADWPNDVKIGVFVAHDTDSAFEAGFEGLKIVVPEKK